MERWSYLIHLLGWAGPVILIQWLIARKIFRRNELAITIPTLAGGTWFTIADYFAIQSKLWYFDPNKILGIMLGDIPLEEILFFYIVSLIVAQTYIMLLPNYLRR